MPTLRPAMPATVLDDPTRRRPILRAVGWIIAFAVLALAAAMLVPTVLGYGRYVLVSGSMTGTYDTGSVVYTRDQPVSTLRVGDVITYAPPAGSSPQKLVTHRIVERRTARDGRLVFRTMGDANQSADPWTFSLDDQKQAVVAFGVPDIGYAISAFADRRVRMVAIGIPAALIALMALFGLLRDARREGLEREENATGAAVSESVDGSSRPGDRPAAAGGLPTAGEAESALDGVVPHTVFPAEHRHPVLAP